MLRGAYVELQFSRRSITELARTSLVLSYPPFSPIIPPTGQQFPVAEDGNTYISAQTAFLTEPGSSYIRHGGPTNWIYEWEDLNEHGENVPAIRCEFVQKMRLVMTRREFLPMNKQQDVDIGIVEGTMVAQFGTFASGSGAMFSIDVKSFTVETPGLPAALVKILERFVPSNFVPVRAPLPLSAIVGSSGGAIKNCGVAFTADLSAFALRVQLGGAASSYLVNEWIDFHAGNFGNRLLKPDGTVAQWGVLLSPPLVEALTTSQISEGLTEHSEDFRLTGGVEAHWAPDGDHAVVNGGFSGDVLIPCRPHYHVTYDALLTVDQPNMLLSSGNVYWHGDFWDLVACETLAALSGGVIGAAAGLTFGGPLGGVIGFAVGFAAGFVVGIFVASTYEPDFSSADCSQDGHSFTCTRKLNTTILMGSQSLPVDLTRAAADPDGLILTGEYTLPPIPVLNQTLLQIDVKPFDFTPLPVSCGNLDFALLIAGSAEEAAKFTRSEATITVRMVDDNGNLRPIPWVTATRISPDTLNIFPPASIRVIPYADRTVIAIDPAITDANTKAYFNDPYGVTIQVQAPTGTRIVEIDHPQALTPQKTQALRDAALRKLNDCLAHQRGFGKNGDIFNLQWLVDPPEEDIFQLWQVGVLNFQPGDTLQAEGLDGRSLGHAVADGHGIARLTVMTGSGAANGDLTLRRKGNRDLEGEANMRVKQIELIPQGTLSTGGQIRSVTTRMVNGRAFAAVHAENSVALFDVTFPSAPRAYFRTLLNAAEGVEGVAVSDEGLAVWSQNSVTLWSFHAAGPLRAALDGTQPLRTDEQGQAVRSLESAVHLDSMAARIPAGVASIITRQHDRTVPPGDLGPSSAMARRLHASPELLSRKPVPNRSVDMEGSQHVQYYTVGSTILVPTDDGRALRCFAAGRMIDA